MPSRCRFFVVDVDLDDVGNCDDYDDVDDDDDDVRRTTKVKTASERIQRQ